MSPASRSRSTTSKPSSGTDPVSPYAVEVRPRVRKALRQLDPATRKGILEAMRALGTDPVRKLVTPRLVATVIMMFFLTIYVVFLFSLIGEWDAAVAVLRLVLAELGGE